ncbi:MAG: hypothetical protein HYZ42_15805 [Bacteroidetes bacterium]|nr:hypothetical protein [Bacteroidota bacterium]
MKKPVKLFILSLLCFFSLSMYASVPARLSQITNDDFKSSLNRIIQSALKEKLVNMKGTEYQMIFKNGSKIEKWNAVDSLPGQLNGYIVQSFCTSFRSIYAESAELNEEILAQFGYIDALLKEALPTALWTVHEEVKPDGSKRTSISRLSSSELSKWPDVNLEIVKKEGKYMLQLSVSI